MSRNKQLQAVNGMSEFLIYTTQNGKVKIEAFVYNENVWLTQIKIAELFDTTKQNISLHLQNIYSTNELDENSTVKKILTVQK